MRRILTKLSVCSLAFGAGIVWGVVAEAAEAGVPLTQLFWG